MSTPLLGQLRLVPLLFLSFAPVTDVFFGHTSHRAFLDVYCLMYAAFVVVRWNRQLEWVRA